MEAISIKFEEEFLKTLEEVMKKHHYATKAEFIREAIREKFLNLEKQEQMMKVLKLYGAGKRRQITDQELHKTREKVAREMAKELGVELK